MLNPMSETAARRLLGLAGWLEKPVVWAGSAASWLILPLIGVIVLDATCRKYLRKLDVAVDTGIYEYMNSPVFQDAEWHLHAIVLFCAFGYAYVHNAHVRLDIFRPRLGAAGRVWVELLGGLALLLPFLGVMVYHSRDFLLAAWSTGETTAVATGIGGRWFIKTFMPLGLILMLAATLAVMIRLAVYALGPPATRDAAGVKGYVRDNHSAFE